MADCLQYLYAGVANFALSEGSPLYNKIRAAGEMREEIKGVAKVPAPEIGSVVFEIDTPDQAEASLEEPNFAPGTPPALSGGLPTLEAATYKAVQSVIDYEFDSAPIPDITYQTSEGPELAGDARAPSPPLDYPTIAGVTIPDPPSDLYVKPPKIVMGERPALPTIIPESFQATDLSPLDVSDLLPESLEVDVERLDFQPELRYEDDAALRAHIHGLMQGSGLLDQWIPLQGELYRGDTSRVDRDVKKAIDAIMEDAAKRNFSDSFGPAEAAQIDVYENEAREREDAIETVRNEVYEKSQEVVVNAIAESVKIERYHFALFMRYIRQNIKVYAYNLKLAEAAYNMVLSNYRAQEQIVSEQVRAYNQYVRAVAQQNEAISGEIEYTNAALARFKAQTDMFSADARTLRIASQVRALDAEQQVLPLEVYESQLRGVVANLGVAQQNIASFKEAIGAYSKYYEWFDSSTQAYESEVAVSASQVAVNQEKFDAYRRLWAMEGDRTSAYRQYLAASTGAMDAELQSFRAAVSTQRDYLTNVLRALSASDSVARDYGRASAEGARYAGQYNAANIDFRDAQNSIAIADAQLKTAEDGLAADTAVQTARLDVAYQEAQLRAAGALSQSASSIFQSSLGASGSASHRVSGNESGQVSASVQDRKQFSKDCSYVVKPATTG